MLCHGQRFDNIACSRLDRRVNTWLAVRFVLLHVAALAVFIVPFTPALLGWLTVSYVIRMFGVTAGYHRYFSHRSYKTRPSRAVRDGGAGADLGQKGVLWWAAHHRDHHRHADRPEDVHSPRHGWWWSHAGWILSTERDHYDPARVADFGRVSRAAVAGSSSLGAARRVRAGGAGSSAACAAFAWGFLLATVALYHATFAINSVAHIWGTRPFATADDSRNNLLLALITLGEGWHNNHHHCRSSCRQGVEWWQVDATYLVLRVLAAVGIARDLRPFVVRQERIAA